MPPVPAEALSLVERAEAALHALGYRQVRVRHQGLGARIELDADGLRRSCVPEDRELLIAAVRGAGYEQVFVDPRGYRPAGSV